MADCVKVICHSNFRVNSILNLFSFLNMNETCYVRIAKGSVSHCEASREIRNMSNSYIIISLDYYIDFSSKKIMDGRKMCRYDEKCTPSLTRLALLP